MQVRSVRNPIFDRIELAMKELQGVQSKVGWLKGIRYEKTGIPVAEVAATQELGSAKKKIPPRPFIMPTVHEKIYDWKQIAYYGSKEIIQGSSSAYRVIGLIGDKASGQIKQKIETILYPPLSPYTIKKRLSNYKNQKHVGNLYKPLVDTAHMVNSLTYTVEYV